MGKIQGKHKQQSVMFSSFKLLKEKLQDHYKLIDMVK